MTLIVTNRSAIAYHLKRLQMAKSNSFIRDEIWRTREKLACYDNGEHRRIFINKDKTGSFELGISGDRGILIASYDGVFYSYSDWFLKVTADIKRYGMDPYVNTIRFVSDCGVDVECIPVQENHPEGSVNLYRCWLPPEKQRIVEWTIRGKILDWYENLPDIIFDITCEHAIYKAMRRMKREDSIKVESASFKCSPFND